VTDDSTLITTGTDVAVHSNGKHFPGRVKRVLRNGKEVESVEWVGSSGKGFELELSTGAIVKPKDTTPGDHHCIHCDQRLTEDPIGTFTCSCNSWKLGL